MPITSLSLSRVSDEAIGIALTCINSWGRAMREMAEPGDMRIVVCAELNQLLYLGPIGQNLGSGWCRRTLGRAVWMLGDRLYKVQTVLHSLERQVTHTNAALEGA